ncbi:MAG: acetate/propionate family kinase, partial [Candidatus Limnocylindria bacterium]|nr:acetate/propionate family kinase [Candidatus Limnocylindria bacterium]
RSPRRARSHRAHPRPPAPHSRLNVDGCDRGGLPGHRTLTDREGERLGSVRAAGHRVVHGGSVFTRTTLIDDGVLRRIRELAPLAPLHNPVAAEVIAAARAALPAVPHAAAFDSAFHATLPKEAYLYALPYEWYSEWGYRRYGFHGLSVAWSVERAATLLARDDLGVVVAHLGAGCSVSAVWQGRSVSTSMGMTPLEGLVMATRAGSIDSGLLLAAQRDHGLDVSALEDVLEHRSGLFALSGRTADMRELVALAPTDERAALAIAVFERSAAAAIAAAATALPGLDAVVFTGGIGEHAATVRAGIVRRLASIGLPPIDEASVGSDRVLAASPIAVLAIVAREDVVIAREVSALTP